MVNATTIGEIDAAFAALAQERADALFVAPDPFFSSRRVQFAVLAARDKIPATYAQREYVAAGGLTSYGTDIADMYHQVGVHTGNILKGAKPADLPVVQPTTVTTYFMGISERRTRNARPAVQGGAFRG